MKRFLLALSLCLCTLGLNAGDIGSNMQLQANGYYLNLNALGESDGFYWARVRSCGHSYHCGCHYTWKWITVMPYVQQAGTVHYTPNWKDGIVKAMDRAKDNEQFIQAIGASGLRVAGGYGEYGGYAQGISVMKQGYGYQAIGDVAALDIGALFQLESQAVARAQDYGGQAALNLSSNVREATDVERIRAASQGLVDAMKASQLNKTEVRQWQTGPAPAYPQPNQGGQVNALGQPGAAALAIRGEVVLANTCASCHSGAEAKAGLDLSQIASYTAQERDDLADLVHKRINSRDPAKVMPPPDKGNPLTAEEKAGVFEFIRGS